jgi:hypothetical protein
MLTCTVAVARKMAYRQQLTGMRCFKTLRSKRLLTTIAQAGAGPTAAYGGQQWQLAAAATQLHATLQVESAWYLSRSVHAPNL